MNKRITFPILLISLLALGLYGCVSKESSAEDRFAIDELAIVNLTAEEAKKLFKMAKETKRIGKESITQFRVGKRVYRVTSQEWLLTIPIPAPDLGQGMLKEAKVKMTTECTHPGCDTLITGGTCSTGGCRTGDGTCSPPSCSGQGCVPQADSCTMKNTGVLGAIDKPTILGP